jgi:hypothetical protein
MSDTDILIAILTFTVGCFFGSRFKENQVSYRLNLLRSQMDGFRDRLRRLESPDSRLSPPPTVEYRK